MNQGENGNKPLRVIEFRAQNTKAIKAVQIFPEGKDVVILTGKNRQGKSSIIDSIWMALSGKSSIPEKPVRRGQESADIFLDLGDFRISRSITGKNESLKVEARDGQKVSSPQKFLSSCLADLAQNPLEFMRLKSAGQANIVQGLFPLPMNQSEVEKIAGLAAKTIVRGSDAALYIDNVSRALYEERTEINREIKRLEGVVESINVPRHLADIQPVSIADLMAEKGELDQQKKSNEDIRSQAGMAEASVIQFNKAISAKNREIEGLELKLQLLRDEKVSLVKGLDDVMNTHFALMDQVDVLIDPDYTDIDRRIADSDQHNKTATEVQQQRKVLSDAKISLSRFSLDSQKLTSQIDDLKAYKLRLICQAKLPLPGLGFEDGKVTYNGLPLDQASGREQIEISCAICLAQHPRIGIITIDVGWSELDQDGQSVIREFARKTGAQIWVTQVKEEPGSEGFHIVDGELTAVDGVSVSEDCGDVPGTDGILVADDDGNINSIAPEHGLW